jgi:hypothetical protein
VQLVGEPPPLVLLRRDDLVRQPRALGLAHLCVLEQLRVLVLARGEVREHGRAHDVVARRTGVAVRRSAPISSSRARSGMTIAFSAGARRGRSPGASSCARASNSRSASCACARARRRCRRSAHRLDERLEEARLARELLLAASWRRRSVTSR